MSGRPLRFLFVLASPEYLRYFDSTLRELVERGHDVAVGVNWLRERKHARLDALIDDARIRVLGAVPKRADVWTPMARAVRGTMDFVRYLHPRFADAPALRARMYRKVLPPVARPLDRIRSLSEPALARWLGALAALERVIPVSGRLQHLLEAERPDVVVVSPLVDAASDQVDTVRAAHAAGVPVVAAIASWDNLTNKGLLRVQPDLVTVWNARQRVEATEFHGVPAERVAVTGAQLFDRWFERAPSTTRAEFCRIVGLPDDRPFVLFTGSSVFIARSDLEEPFVRRWIQALRASADPQVRDVAVLVRPHPFNCDAWTESDMSTLGPVAIWPRHRYTPAAEEARRSFFDSLYHSAAVVGINTSAMIEAAIVGRPVLAIATPEFATTQEGTLHFRHLLPENGGFLRVAASIDAHLPQLAGVLHDPQQARAELDAFVGSFVRPHGREQACTPLLADVLEGAAREGRPRESESILLRAARVGLVPVALSFRVLSAGAALRSLSRRGAYEVRYRASRTLRILIKRGVVWPARWLRGVGKTGYRFARRGVRGMVQWGVRWPARRAVRAGRLLRYYVGTWLRGGPLDGTGDRR